MVSRAITGSNGPTVVRTASRSIGGVEINDKSLIPLMASCSVRGIGVAVRVRTWVSARNSFRRSLCFTPKRCSSSTTISPISANFTVLANSAWVPMTISTVPSLSPARVLFASAVETSRDSGRTFKGKPLKRAWKFLKCWRASRVVGAIMATWRPVIATTNAARSATSVLPNPTSPHTRRSIGRPRARSSITSAMAFS